MHARKPYAVSSYAQQAAPAPRPAAPRRVQATGPHQHGAQAGWHDLAPNALVNQWPMAEQLRHAKELSALSDDAYFNANDKEAGRDTGPYTRLSPAELTAMGVAPELLDDPASGFAAAVYRHKATEGLVLAFRGSEGFADWKTNFLTTLGIRTENDQYARAERLYQALAATGAAIEVTGHSLGGGLANYVGIKHGSSSTTFNAKGATWRERSEIANYDARAQALATNYSVGGDVLTTLQEFPVFNALVGGPAGVMLDALVQGAPGQQRTLPGGPAFELGQVHPLLGVLQGGRNHMMSAVKHGLDMGPIGYGFNPFSLLGLLRT